MDKEFKKGKWANTSDYHFLDVYNVGPELVASPKILQGRIDAEEHSKLLDQLNKIYEINFEPSKGSLEEIIDYVIKHYDKANN